MLTKLCFIDYWTPRICFVSGIATLIDAFQKSLCVTVSCIYHESSPFEWFLVLCQLLTAWLTFFRNPHVWSFLVPTTRVVTLIHSMSSTSYSLPDWLTLLKNFVCERFLYLPRELSWFKFCFRSNCPSPGSLVVGDANYIAQTCVKNSMENHNTQFYKNSAADLITSLYFSE